MLELIQKIIFKVTGKGTITPDTDFITDLELNSDPLMTEECPDTCGKCLRACPVQAIEMRNKKPVWIKDQCVMCLGCLHRCPSFAIQYGRRTARHGQYTNSNVKL